jgi:hypothetical protein
MNEHVLYWYWKPVQKKPRSQDGEYCSLLPELFSTDIVILLQETVMGTL